MLAAARQRDRYAQDSAFAADARTAVQVSKDIQRLVREHSIEALAAMEWGDGPDHDEDDTPDAAPLPHRHRHPTRGLRVTSTMAEDAEDAALDADEADDDDEQQTAPAKTSAGEGDEQQTAPANTSAGAAAGAEAGAAAGAMLMQKVTPEQLAIAFACYGVLPEQEEIEATITSVWQVSMP